MAEITLEKNAQAARMVSEMIDTIDDHKDLKDADFVCLTTSQNLKSAGKVVRGKSSKAGALVRYFASGDFQDVTYGPDFILLFPDAVWNGATDEQRAYVVDHCLSHCRKEVKVTRRGDVTEKFVIVGPDVQAFKSVIERRGFQFADLTHFADAVRRVDGARQLLFAEERRSPEPSEKSVERPPNDKAVRMTPTKGNPATPSDADEAANAQARLAELSRA